MGIFENYVLLCPRDQHCFKWAEMYMKYCLCGTKDVVSLTLGLISVLSWGVAEIPQIITNYKEKSTEGLSIVFLLTWLLGDFLNLIGCKLEPATLPTQYYMAMLYTVTTLTLATQSLYYSHIYRRLKSDKRCNETDTVVKNRQRSNDIDKKQVDSTDGIGNRSGAFSSGVSLSSPIPLPAHAHNGSIEGELYYTSARSLSRSHTPTVGFHMQRITSSVYECTSIEEPLIGGHVSTQSAPSSKTKTMLCVVSAVTFFLSISNLQLAESNRNMVFEKQNRGFVVQVGRKLLQVSGSLLQETGSTDRAKIGSFLGWGMAAIYMGGRLPQILLNFRRGNVQVNIICLCWVGNLFLYYVKAITSGEYFCCPMLLFLGGLFSVATGMAYSIYGLNPLMFIFALVGNVTYVASILVSSLDWSKIGPNLPWLVDAGGCVVLDTLILIQFVYFRFHSPLDIEIKHGHSNIT